MWMRKYFDTNIVKGQGQTMYHNRKYKDWSEKCMRHKYVQEIHEKSKTFQNNVCKDEYCQI